MTHTTRAIIINYQKYKEYDRVYTVYSEDFGKLLLLARGSNKTKSKLAGHLEPCVLSSLMIADGKGFDVLAQAQTIKSFIQVRQEPEKYNIASVMLESVDKLTHTHQKDERIFNLLVKGLGMIGRLDIYHFLLHLLILLGHAHNVEHESVLKNLIVAGIAGDDIIVEENARELIKEYLHTALDDRKLFSFQNF